MRKSGAESPIGEESMLYRVGGMLEKGRVYRRLAFRMSPEQSLAYESRTPSPSSCSLL